MHSSAVLNKVASVGGFNELIPTRGVTNKKDRISFSKLVQLLNNRGPVSVVQKAGRVVNKKRKATAISQDDVVGETIEVVEEEVVQEAAPAVVAKKAKKVSKAGRAVIAERVKALRARGGALKSPTRSAKPTPRARANNTE